MCVCVLFAFFACLLAAGFLTSYHFHFDSPPVHARCDSSYTPLLLVHYLQFSLSVYSNLGARAICFRLMMAWSHRLSLAGSRSPLCSTVRQSNAALLDLFKRSGPISVIVFYDKQY